MTHEHGGFDQSQRREQEINSLKAEAGRLLADSNKPENTKKTWILRKYYELMSEINKLESRKQGGDNDFGGGAQAA
mgnify:CR=1 FL=1